MNEPMKQYEVLQRASLFLEQHNRETNIAALLLQYYLQVSRSAFFMKMRDPVPDAVVQQFQNAVKAHAETGVPIQHLIGHEVFYGRTFHVNEHVLIPRPETEELVHHVMKRIKHDDQPLTIADIGTGSGIIACTLALELKNCTVYATDISEKALTVAENNANQLGANVTFLQGDFLQPLIDKQIKADIIISNPPYIARSDESSLSDTVKLYDPELALFAEENGLAAYREIITKLPHVISDHAYVAFEIGYQQGASVTAFLENQFPESTVNVIQDINGKDRIVAAEIAYNS
ncbi:peptide chain release factor N(5)-glutamine methyltransferase [Virgibacillus sp. FSP13]